MWLVYNNSAGDVYRFYKDHPEIKIRDDSSPNLWQAWATTLTWDWGTGDKGIRFGPDTEYHNSYEDLLNSARRLRI